MPIKSTLDKVKVSRLTFGFEKLPKATFDLGADLKEVDAEKGVLRLGYVLYLETFPSILRAEMEGTAVLPLKGFSNQQELESLISEQVSDIAIAIFRNNYEALYLLFDSLGLPPPSPWLVRDVYLMQPALVPPRQQVSQIAVPPQVR